MLDHYGVDFIERVRYNIAMTTVEKTIAMLNTLSESENLNVQNYIQRLLMAKRRKREAKLQPMTGTEIVARLNESEEQIRQGKVYTMRDVRIGVAERYGF